MTKLSGLGLVDAFELSNERERLFCARGGLRKRKSFRVGREGVVIVVAILNVGILEVRVAPDTVFKNFVPHVPTTNERGGGVRAYQIRINRVRVASYFRISHFL